MSKETVGERLMVAAVFLIATVAVAVYLVALPSCRLGRAKIEGDTPYGNAVIDVEDVEIDGAPAPDDAQAD